MVYSCNKISILIVSLIGCFILLVSSVSREQNDDVQVAIDWFIENGGYISPAITIADTNGMGRGIMAISDVLAESEILKIPGNMIFSTDSVKKLNINSPIAKLLLEFKGEQSVVVWLLYEKLNIQKSTFKPYLDVLPEYVSSLLYFSDRELAMMQNSKLKQQVLKFQQDTFRDYSTFVAKSTDIPSLANVPFSEYQWAVSIVNSRALRFRGEVYLTPFADMFNYAPHPSGRHSNSGEFFLKHHKLRKEENDIVILADRDCVAGEQLHEDYGDNPDSIYLQYHGFVPSVNPFRCVEVDTNDLALNKISDRQRQLLAALEFRRGPVHCVEKSGVLPFSFQVYVAALSLSASEVEHCLEVVRTHPRQWKTISEQCGLLAATAQIEELRRQSDAIEWSEEGAAVESLQRVLSAALKASHFSTTIQQDRTLLANLPQGDDRSAQHERLAVSYRLHAKELWLDLCTIYRLDSCESLTVESSAPPVAEKKQESQRQDRIVPLAQKIEEFNVWFAGSIPSPGKIFAKVDPVYRVGTYASESIRKGDRYLGVPSSIIMDSATAFADERETNSVGPLIRQLVRTYRQRDDFHELLFFLLFETFVAREASLYWPYLQLLPSPAETDIPLMWTDEQVQSRLGASQVIATVRSYRNNTMLKFNSVSNLPIVRDFFPAGVLTFENYRWATAILDSRSIWWNGKRHLVPMLDLVNCREDPHYPQAVHSTNLDESQKYAVTTSGGDFGSGQQVFENYGQPNHIYFTYHGFILQPHNSNDCVHFPLALHPTERARVDPERAIRTLQALQLSPNAKAWSREFCLSSNGLSEQEDLWLFLALKSNDVSSTSLGKQTEAASAALLVMVNDAIARHEAYANTEHTASALFVNSELVVLRGIRDSLTDFIANEDEDEL